MGHDFDDLRMGGLRAEEFVDIVFDKFNTDGLFKQMHRILADRKRKGLRLHS